MGGSSTGVYSRLGGCGGRGSADRWLGVAVAIAGRAVACKDASVQVSMRMDLEISLLDPVTAPVAYEVVLVTAPVAQLVVIHVVLELLPYADEVLLYEAVLLETMLDLDELVLALALDVTVNVTGALLLEDASELELRTAGTLDELVLALALDVTVSVTGALLVEDASELELLAAGTLDEAPAQYDASQPA
ncbi:hypothetical protein Tdes44962_MAKER05936 [Teratosphaeria destructans]|uniref:Uncharacterized protein n=1 Tax=Teratosphaeria destructans TaxID=418781 RepID=A0A9W7SJ06_9PEZI|nr:hypothetical protein Tdes44962_MAKER05936 [Teratosphaeria destructans]